MKYILAFFLLITLHANAQYNGVNIGEGTFGKTTDKLGYGYRYPSNAEILQAKMDGFDLIRVGFRWERLQPVLNGDLNQKDLGELKRIADYAKSIEVKVLMDLHNYAGYNELKADGSTVRRVVNDVDIGRAELADFWTKLAVQFNNDKNVILGIMNEPSGVEANVWAGIQQHIVTSIRKLKLSNRFYLSGNIWSGAHSFTNIQSSGTSNATEMESVVDPYKNYVIEVHQYFDNNSSGTSFNCVSEDVGVQRLTKVTEWARLKGIKLFLGEFAAGRNSTCYNAMKKALDYMKANSDVWEGWAYWASIDWFGSKYEFNIHPKAVPNAPQLKILQGQCY